MPGYPCCCGQPCDDACNGLSKDSIILNISGLNATLNGDYVLGRSADNVGDWFINTSGGCLYELSLGAICGSLWMKLVAAIHFVNGVPPTYYFDVALVWDCDGWAPLDSIYWRYTYTDKPDCRGEHQIATAVSSFQLCGTCDMSSWASSLVEFWT